MELIKYINSLHNLNASGTNSLAESQVNSSYFKDIYHPFPIVESLKDIISNDKEAIIILTGHAGDGKSTIAFELLRELGENKYFQGYQFDEYEHLPEKSLHVLKDMSELSLEHRRNWLSKAFHSPGNWLIVSNTGPLLTSIADSLRETSWNNNCKPYQIESSILEYLDKEIPTKDLSSLRLPDVNSKELYIINIAKLNNIDVALNIFKKIINHPEWRQVIENYPDHPITTNYLTVRHYYQEVEESIRLTYLYLLNYEKRMTLRQMLAHLSVSLTGGFNLSDDWENATKKTNLLFSDTFFGYIGSNIWHESQDLKVMQLISRIHAGGYSSLELENFIIDANNFKEVSEPLKSIVLSYIQKDAHSESHHEKANLRRILFMYGLNSNKNAKSLFLGSKCIYKYNNWQLDPTSFEDASRRIKRLCDKALNLFYSGSDDKQHINITLKRSDSSVFQIAQLLICSIPKNALRISYDEEKQLPYIYLRDGRRGESSVRLDLSLPLLDYIENIVIGDVTESLNPIYKTQLERFKLSLIDYAQDIEDDEITLIRMKSDGKVDSLNIYFEQTDEQKTIRVEV